MKLTPSVAFKVAINLSHELTDIYHKIKVFHIAY